MGILALVLATGVDAQITRTATFDNYAAGTDLGIAFTDPLSGISFDDSTATNHKFVINNGLPEFSGSNYISNGANWAFSFGFDANLPVPADDVSIDVTYESGVSQGIVLVGFSGSNGTGTIISQQSISGAADPYVLGITSSQYNIASFMVSVDDVFTGYDNISYAYLPEPSIAAILLGLAVPPICRRK